MHKYYFSSISSSLLKNEKSTLLYQRLRSIQETIFTEEQFTQFTTDLTKFVEELNKKYPRTKELVVSAASKGLTTPFISVTIPQSDKGLWIALPRISGEYKTEMLLLNEDLINIKVK